MEAFRIVGGKVVLEDRVVENGTVAAVGGRIIYAGPAEGFGEEIYASREVGRLPAAAFSTYDAAGGWVFPGFIDVHVHGGGGSDAMNATAGALERIARIHGRHGTTGFLATTMTAAHKDVCGAARAVRDTVAACERAPWEGARLLGLHLEGPYLNPKRAGAQDPALMRPAVPEELREIAEILGDALRLVTLAPEIEGGMAALRFFCSAGAVVSLGHTDADTDQARAAFRAGARHVTHMFNGMRPLHHRDPGIAGVALLEEGAVCKVIADGIHLHPDAIRLLFRIKGADGLCLITDAIEATGMPEGIYQLGGLEVRVQDGACRLTSNGSLAGSVLTMDRAVGYVVEVVGLPVVAAARMAALVPARQLRLADRKGSLRVGKDADIAVLDSGFRAVATWVEGRRIA